MNVKCLEQYLAPSKCSTKATLLLVFLILTKIRGGSYWGGREREKETSDRISLRFGGIQTRLVVQQDVCTSEFLVPCDSVRAPSTWFHPGGAASLTLAQLFSAACRGSQEARTGERLVEILLRAETTPHRYYPS